MPNLNNLIITQMTFGKCKVCKVKEAVYSRGVCKDCEDKRNKVIRKLYEKGLEPGTIAFIEELKKEKVYY